MKRTVPVILALAITTGAIAAPRPLPSEVRAVLMRAVSGEREAVARYESFARKADKEGYRGAAALFRAEAKAEGTHAQRFSALLVEHGEAVPEPSLTSFNGDVGTTRDNLRSAMAAETAERDGSYRQAIDTCNQHDAPDIAKVFDQTRDSEVEHANLCATAARDLEAYREAMTFYVCGVCGYTTDVKLPYCPACQHRHAPAPVE